MIKSCPLLVNLSCFFSDSLHNQCSIIKSLDCFLHSSERFCETNVHLHDQVLSTSCESLVFLFIKNNDDVSRLQSWFLVTLAAECDLLTIFHTLVNLNFKNLPFSIDFSSITFLTS